MGKTFVLPVILSLLFKAAAQSELAVLYFVVFTLKTFKYELTLKMVRLLGCKMYSFQYEGCFKCSLLCFQ